MDFDNGSLSLSLSAQSHWRYIDARKKKKKKKQATDKSPIYAISRPHSEAHVHTYYIHIYTSATVILKL